MNENSICMWCWWLNRWSYSKEINNFVRGLDLEYPEFAQTVADEFINGDLEIPLL